jgi:ketosteroid isomerase-like protein
VALSVEDRLDILELLTRADDAASRRDVAAYLALFTDDAVMDGDKGAHRGKAALSAAVGPVWASEGASGTRHLTLNAVVEAGAGLPSTAVATSTLLIVALGGPPQLQRVAAITHEVTKIDGAWLVRRRTVHEFG